MTSCHGADRDTATDTDEPSPHAVVTGQLPRNHVILGRGYRGEACRSGRLGASHARANSRLLGRGSCGAVTPCTA